MNVEDKDNNYNKKMKIYNHHYKLNKIIIKV